MRIPVCILPGHVHVFPPWPINRLIFYTNTPYGKRKEPFLSVVKNNLCMPSSSILTCGLPKKHEPASGVAAGASAAYRFCTSKIKIKSDLYPPRNIFWPYTLQPPRRQEFQPASQLSPIVTNTVPWIASLLYAQPNTPWEHVDLSLH